MKFFIDTANPEDIHTAEVSGALDDVVISSSLMTKEGIAGDAACREHYLRICNATDGDVSAGVFGITYDKMLSEARGLATLHKNIVIKVSCTQSGIRTICQLTKEGIWTNCTFIFNLGQAILATEAGAIYASPSVGRPDDIGSDGVSLIADIVETFGTYGFNMQVLVASTRRIQHVIDCMRVSADVATCPLKAILGLLEHPLTDSGLAVFMADQKRIAKQGR